MIQLVTEYETSLAHQCGYVHRVSGEAHAKSHGLLHAQKLGHQVLQLNVTLERAEFLARAARGHVKVVNALHGRFGRGSIILGEAQIVVGAHIERFLHTARHVEGPVVVVRASLGYFNLSARHRAYGPIEAVTYAYVDIARVETLVALVERHEVRRIVVGVAFALFYAHIAQKVAKVAEYVQHGVAYVRVDRLDHGRVLEHFVLVLFATILFLYKYDKK